MAFASPKARVDVRRFPVIAVAATVAGAGLLYADQEPKFRAGTHSVSVYATVIDQGGRLVPDLTREDFEVFDNGTRQTLTLFENDVRPITVVMMLDRSGSMLGSFDLVRDAAAQFVMNLLPMDKARIGSFSNRIQVDPPAFTSEPNELLRILHEELQEAGPTPLWNATSVAMTALAHEAGRRVVLIFTDGKDSESRPGSGASFAEVRARARADELG